MPTDFGVTHYTPEAVTAMTPTDFANSMQPILAQILRQSTLTKTAVNTLETGVVADALVVQERVFTILAADLTEEDGSQTIVDAEGAFPAGARLLNSWVKREAMTGQVALTTASVEGGTEPFDLSGGDKTLTISVNNAGNALVTFTTGVAGYFEPTSDGPYDMTSVGFVWPRTWFVQINGGDSVTVGFLEADFANPAAATAAEIATRLNLSLAGTTTTVVGARFRCTSTALGTWSEVMSSGGFVPWAFQFGSTQGSGNIPDLADVSAAEAGEAIRRGLGSPSSLVVGGGPGLTLTTVATGAAAEIDIVGGTAAAILGLDVGVVNGTNATTLTVDLGYNGGADKLADGMNLLASGDTPGTGTNATPNAAVDLGGKTLQGTVVSNYDVADVAGGGGLVELHVVWVQT